MKAKTIDPEKLIGSKWPVSNTKLTIDKALIYAVGVGASSNPLDEDDLKFTYEGDEDFKPLPTVATVLHGAADIYMPLVDSPEVPVFDPTGMLHAENILYCYKPILPEQPLICDLEFGDVTDTGKAAIIEVKINYRNEQEELLATHAERIFIRKLGGFGFKGKDPLIIPERPMREPDLVLSAVTFPNQALIYRISGDANPMHAQPQFAQMGGYDRPILHGLCSYGQAARLIIKHYCQNDPDKLFSIKARFTSHVYPGETLVFDTWKAGNVVLFYMKTAERNIDAMIGYAELKEAPSVRL